MVWQGDCTNIAGAATHFAHDILFLDPPWTGEGYREYVYSRFFFPVRNYEMYAAIGIGAVRSLSR